MPEITKEQAIAIGESKLWENWTDEEKVKFQLFTPKLCMPFDVFVSAVEKILHRIVWDTEFTDTEYLQAEYLQTHHMPTFEEIINLIPEEKRIILEI